MLPTRRLKIASCTNDEKTVDLLNENLVNAVARSTHYYYLTN